MVLPPALKIAVQISVPEDLVVLVNQSFMHARFLWGEHPSSALKIAVLPENERLHDHTD
jgi:hypothetical protein